MFSSTEDLPDDWEPTTTWAQVLATMNAEPAGGFEAYNLGQIKRIVADSVEDQVLQLVHHPQQVFS